MAWTIGEEVTLDGDGNVATGSGARLALYDARKDEVEAPNYMNPSEPPKDIEDPNTGGVIKGWDEDSMGSWPDFCATNNPNIKAAWLKSKRALATECNNIAQGLISFALSNIVASVVIHKATEGNEGDFGLQLLPHDIEENKPTKAPSENKTLIGGIA